MDNKQIRILLYSLEMIGNFSKDVGSIRSGSEFLVMHNRNIESILEFSRIRTSDYFANKVEEYPSFTENELDEYIKEKNSNGLLLIIGGWLIALFALIYKTAKTGGKNLGATKNKLEVVKSINENLKYVIENPGFEELIKSNNA